MALEALGVAANVAGLIELGLSVCDGLWKYYRSWKDADDDVRKMFAEIESLSKTFAILQTTLARPSLDPDLVHRINEIVATCEEGILSLNKKLQKIRDTSAKTSKMSTKFKAQIQRALYPFKESTLVKLKEISRELQDHLILALNILQVVRAAVPFGCANAVSYEAHTHETRIEHRLEKLNADAVSEKRHVK
ncbi:MAG: hypothetical protein Q9205_003989 [Flavoplaca limonia]